MPSTTQKSWANLCLPKWSHRTGSIVWRPSRTERLRLCHHFVLSTFFNNLIWMLRNRKTQQLSFQDMLKILMPRWNSRNDSLLY